MTEGTEARMPEDPSGIDEPHDVLAAEEFPLPAAGAGESESGSLDPRSLIPALVLALLVLVLLARRRR